MTDDTKALRAVQELVYYATLGLWAAQEAAAGKLKTIPQVGNLDLELCVKGVTDCLCGAARIELATSWKDAFEDPMFLTPIFMGV